MPDRAARRGRYALASWIFQRLLGASALSAFVSLHVQVLGLFGAEGVLPIAPRLARAHEALGGALWASRPTLLLATGASDGALVALCAVGELAALALALGVAPGPAALLSALAYVSLVNVGAPFFPLQWDALLIEALWITALLAPWRALVVPPWRATEPPAIARWALWLLLARLMLASGIVKWIGDEVWRDLSALSYHYETQPLPGPLSPFMHALPMPAHQLGALFTFFVELPVPFLVFGPRRARHFAAACIALLQIAIALTGNFGFFNLLTASMCVLLVDDAAISSALPAAARAHAAPGEPRPAWWHVALPSALATFLIALQLAQLATSLGAPAREPVVDLIERTQPLWLTSSYGLFADMTTERPELVIEGSEDGERWLPYPFRYKPGDPERALPFTGPHLPRLDWMLWFAALGRPEDAPWVGALERALLEGRPPVLALFARDPFEGRRPRYVRVVAWDYRFAPPGGEATWIRARPRPWGPVLRR